VIGVLGRELAAGAPDKGKGQRNINREVFVPLQTVDLRYGDLLATFKSGSRELKRVEYSDLYVNVDEEANVLDVSRNLKRIMQHGHNDQDYNIDVPLELLQQVERNKRLWQAVLGSIAGISLLVGGIGIMNIMLASVTERTREIGIRRALGARRHHITAQFLIETLILSICGGLVGVVLGIGCARLVSVMLDDLDAIVTLWGVALSFGVSAVVGIGFGLYPAQAAAKLDPIEALRYE
jgi:putative ABC transport system permease protein